MKTRKVLKRTGSLVATCEVCGIRGGPAIVAYKVEYWADWPEAKGGKVTCRCLEHAPGYVESDDMSQIEIDNR